MPQGRLLSVLLVNVVILAAGAVVLELAFGNWVRPNRMNRLNIVRDRTIHYDPSALYEATGPITYTRDRWGLRGDFDSPADVDVLTLGGSAADQRFIADGATWQDVIQRSFQRDGRRVVVANAGVDGQSTYGHIKNFDWWFPFVPGLVPKYVLVYVGSNDLYRDPGYEMDELARPRGGWKTRVRDSSALYHVLRTLRASWKARVVHDLEHHHEDIDAWKWTTVPMNDDPAEDIAGRIAAYRARLGILAGRIHAMGATPIFVTQVRYIYRMREDGTVEGNAHVDQFDDMRVNGVDLYHMMEEIRIVTLEVARDAGAIGIDAATEVSWAREDFYDSVHNTPQGAEKLGRYLYERLAPLF